MDIQNKENIPRPTIHRLCKIYSFISDLEETGIDKISSSQLSKKMGIASHNIRKDISYLGETGISGSGYRISALKERINKRFNFEDERKACVVGLDCIGSMLLNYEKLLQNKYKIIAGFDTNINRLETIKIDIPVYPTHQIEEIISKNNINLAIMSVTSDTARKVSDRLIKGGIKGIINFSPLILSSTEPDVHITNIDLVDEFRYLSSLIELN